MANINARSPFIITINEALQIETKVELFLWNGIGSAPALPTYTESKLIPSPTNTATYYNISPFIREFIKHTTLQAQPATTSATPTTQWCNVLVKKYKKTTTTFVLVGTNLDVKAIDGYGFFLDGSNPSLPEYSLIPADYQYNIDSSVGWITVYTGSIRKARWTNLDTLVVNTETMTADTFRDVSKVYTGWESVGNKLEFLDISDTVLFTYNFTPKESCKYTPVRIDFVNRFGAWRREWFYAASNDTLTVEGSEYNLMLENFPSYLYTEGQRKMFNVNGKNSIKVNTNWVDESFKNVISEIMLSENILIDGLPAKLNTKTIDLQKHINNKMINYQLDFEFAYDAINNIV
jgi:hypothetical protein